MYTTAKSKNLMTATAAAASPDATISVGRMNTQLPAHIVVLRADLRRRAIALRMEIAAAERKRGGIEAAIVSRRGALNRLLAQLALCECGAASSHDA